MTGAAERPQAQEAFDAGSWSAIRQSAAQLARDRDAFVRQLHDDIASLIPELTDAQRPDMWAFCERMAQSLLWVALTDQPLGVVADALRRVGGQNWADGFPDSQYPTVAHALVQAVHYLSGSDRSASTGSVWVGYFMWIKPHLLAGAQQAAEQQATEQHEVGHHPNVVGDVNIDAVAGLLVDEEDEDAGSGQPMVAMTRNQRRDHHSHRHTS